MQEEKREQAFAGREGNGRRLRKPEIEDPQSDRHTERSREKAQFQIKESQPKSNRDDGLLG